VGVQLRRQTRERREFLYRKSQETQEKAVHDRKRRFKEAFDAGRPIPSDLRKDAADLQKAVSFDDANTEGAVCPGRRFPFALFPSILIASFLAAQC
jgi:hypothetical protein